MNKTERENLLLTIINIALKAGEAICKVYNTNFDFTEKEDKSPLTQADLNSNSIIISELEKTGLPIISEEIQLPDYETRKKWKQFWLVDPLDGTKEFVKRLGEFTVNIALIYNQLPEMGVIFAPAKKLLYFGDMEIGSFKIVNPKSFYPEFKDLTREVIYLPEIIRSETLGVVASKSHYDEKTARFVEKLKEKHSDLQLLNIGSSLKFGLLAEGVAQFYPRFAPTYEWDIAAGHAIIRPIGGTVMNYETKNEMTYNKENLLNPYFIAYMLN